MAAKKEDAKILERTYNVPLRKEYLKVANWRRTEKAVTAVKKFLVRHMKSEDVKLSKELNEKLWEHGIKNPPHHIKITANRDEKGVVRAYLFGVSTAKEEKPAAKKETKKTIPKAQTKDEPKVEAAAPTQ